jgi:mannose-6-phosphate isomerase-like protein (cupin superfamily)
MTAVASPARALIVSKGRSRCGEPLAIGPDLWTLNVAAADTDGAMCVMTWEGRASGGPPLHLHHDQDEVFIVEAGRYRFQCGDDQFDLDEGDSIFLPRRVPHSFCQMSSTGRLRYLYTPAGAMEDFFRALAQLPGPPAPEEGAALFAAHGMQVMGPPLSPT